VKVEGVSHVVVLVRDLGKARDFFCRLFETTFDDLGIVHDMGIHSIICPEGIELISPTRADSVFAEILKTRGEGICGIAMRSRDIAGAAKDAREKGVRVTGSFENKQAGKTFTDLKEIFFHPADCHRVAFILSQYADKK